MTGWNTITNAADADLGALVADDAELREARLVELAGAGSATTAAIRAALARVTGVEEVSVYQNVTSGTVAGRPPKSIEAVIWDGVSFVADDDEIAQAIWDSVAAGIEVYGDADSGVATDAGTGETFVVDFTRATVLRLYVDATIALKPGTATGWADEVNAAIVARGQAYGVGEDVYASHLSCAVQALDFVEGVADLRVGTSPSPTGFSTEIGETEIAGIDSADVTVSEAL